MRLLVSMLASLCRCALAIAIATALEESYDALTGEPASQQLLLSGCWPTPVPLWASWRSECCRQPYLLPA